MVRNMVRVYIAKITPLLIEENYRAYYRKIPAWRQEKADKLRFKEDKARSVGAWILWEKIKKAGHPATTMMIITTTTISSGVSLS